MDLNVESRPADAFRRVCEEIAPMTGDDFFQTLVQALCRNCDVDWAVVSELSRHIPGNADTLAICHRDEFIANLTYELAGTPCANVMHESFCHFVQGVQGEFPEDAQLAKMGIESYMGMPLLARDSTTIGIVSIMHSAVMDDPEQIRSILAIVAARAAAELERQHTERALREQQHLTQAIVDTLPHCMYIFDIIHGKTVWSNWKAKQALGYSDAELAIIEENVQASLMHPEDYERLPEMLARWNTVRDGEVLETRLRQRHRDGTYRWFACHDTVFLRNPEGRVQQLIGTMQDITEQMQALESLAASQQRQRLILDSANVGTWEWDLRTNDVSLSAVWKQQLGYEDHEISGRYHEWESRVHPDDLPYALAQIELAVENRATDYRSEFRMRHKNGTWRYIFSRGTVENGVDDKPISLIGVHLDVTDRYYADQALRLQNRVLDRAFAGEPLRDVLEDLTLFVERQIAGSVCIVLLIENETMRTGIGQRLPPDFHVAFDRSPAKQTTCPCGTAAETTQPVIVPDLWQQTRWPSIAELAPSIELRSCWAFPVVAPSGQEGQTPPQVLAIFSIYHRVVASPTEDDLRVISSATALAGLAIEREQASQERREAETRLRSLLENLENVAVQAYEPDGTITFWNRASERLYGHAASDIIGQNLLEKLHEEPGRTIERKLMDEALRSNTLPPAAEVEVVGPGGERRVVLASRVLHPRSGQPPEFYCFDVDVTDRKKAEEQLAARQAELLHAARLSTVGEMIAAISHEVAQPLSAIGNFAAACMATLKSGDKDQLERLTEYVEQIQLQDRRCGDILHRLRDFCRRQSGPRSQWDLNQILEFAVELVGNEFRGLGIRIELNLSPEHLMVACDRIQIEQVIVNLLINARDAIRELPVDRKLIRVASRAVQQECVIEITDRGPGLTTASQARLFEPFFTTKSSGMGLGLSLSRTMIQDHGGRITAETLVEGGACFRVTLPRKMESNHDTVPLDLCRR
ncbi:PAS domain S-box protein [bacterium]|nr:PAS domain S-box protein [bacterium]